MFALADVRWEPGTATERLSIAGELAAAAADAGETELVLEAHLCRLAALLELGDPSFPVELGTFTRMAERAAIPRYLYLARSRQATVASLTGPLETADQLIDEAAAYGERIGEPDTWGVQASQLAGLAYIRHDWTRLSKLAAARGQALMPPEFALHLRAWLLLEAGEKAAAAALVASIPDGPTTYRWRHTAMLTSDAELAAAAGDRNRCATRYEQLLPMADEFAVVGAAVFTTGPVALQLGLLAAALGRWDDAAAHLDDATRRCDRLGAALLAARTRTELARVRSGDRPRGTVTAAVTCSAATGTRGRSPSVAAACRCATRRACATSRSCSPPRDGKWRPPNWSPGSPLRRPRPRRARRRPGPRRPGPGRLPGPAGPAR